MRHEGEWRDGAPSDAPPGPSAPLTRAPVCNRRTSSGVLLTDEQCFYKDLRAALGLAKWECGKL